MPLSLDEQQRVEEAVETLARYNRSPFITDFLREQPAPRIHPGRYDVVELRDVLKQVLLGTFRGRRQHVLRLDDLIDYLDHLQETGRQHVYLFRLPDGGRDELLARLRDRGRIRSLLGGGDELYDGGRRSIREARDGPELALVRFEPAGSVRPRRLLLKWIETYRYFVSTSSVNAAGQRIQVSVPHEERAASFFVGDLETGDCELRIQALHSRAQAARQQQLATYRALVASLFGFELVGPTVLAPAIRHLLITHERQIVHCTAILPTGGYFTGSRGDLPPVDPRRLQAGVTVRFQWTQARDGIARVELDGRLDEILILKPLLPDEHRRLLEDVRRWREEGLADSSEGGEPTTPAAKPSAAEALKKVLSHPGKSVLPAPDSGIDRAVREYVQTHGEDQLAVRWAGVSKPVRGRESPAAPPDERALKAFLAYIKEVAEREYANYEREIEPLWNQERWTFWLSLVAAVLALVTFVAGAVLLITGKLELGTISELLSLLTGHGTRLITANAKALKAKRKAIQEQQRDSRETLMAIQTALSIPDPVERSHALHEVAASLLGRAARAGQPASAPRPGSAAAHPAAATSS